MDEDIPQYHTATKQMIRSKENLNDEKNQNQDKPGIVVQGATF